MDAKQPKSLGQLSKSKAKRLNKRAKYQRIAATLDQEKKKRELVEGSAKHWKHKATLYKK